MLETFLLLDITTDCDFYLFLLIHFEVKKKKKEILIEK